jgi:hypothetical protein
LDGHSGAGVADRVEDIADFGDGLVWRRAGGRILKGGGECAIAGIRVGAILHPAVLLALACNWRIDRFGCDFRLGKGSSRQ